MPAVTMATEAEQGVYYELTDYAGLGRRLLIDLVDFPSPWRLPPLSSRLLPSWLRSFSMFPASGWASSLLCG